MAAYDVPKIRQLFGLVSVSSKKGIITVTQGVISVLLLGVQQAGYINT